MAMMLKFVTHFWPFAMLALEITCKLSNLNLQVYPLQTPILFQDMSTALVYALALCSTFCLSIQVSLHDQGADQTLARYRQRVKIVHELLLAEGCPDPDTRVRRSAPEDARSEILIEVEKAFFDELVERLADCRQKKGPSTTTTKPTTTTHIHFPEPCEQALNVTQPWRHERSPRSQKPISGNPNCDPTRMISDGRPWFRFSGQAGNHLLDHCIPGYRCGTKATLWSNASMPTAIGVVTTIPLYASWDANCFYKTFSCSVVRCSENQHDFVYRWSHSFNGCHYGFCGMS